MENQDNLKQSIHVIYEKLMVDLLWDYTPSPRNTSPLNRLGIITNDNSLVPLFRSNKYRNVTNGTRIETVIDIIKSLKTAVSGKSGHDDLFSFTKNIRIALFNYNACYFLYGMIRLNVLKIEFDCYVNNSKMSHVCYIPFTALSSKIDFTEWVLSSDFSVLPDHIEDYHIRGFVVDLSDSKTNLHRAYSRIKDDQDKNLKKFVSYKADDEVIVYGSIAGKYINTLEDQIIIDSLKVYILHVLWNKDHFAEYYLSALLDKYAIDEKLVTVLRQYADTVNKVSERESLCKFFQYSLAKEIPSHANPNDAIYKDVSLLIGNLNLRTWGDSCFICDEAYNFYDGILSKYIGESDIDYYETID